MIDTTDNKSVMMQNNEPRNNEPQKVISKQVQSLLFLCLANIVWKVY